MMAPSSFNSMIEPHGIADCKPIRLAQLNYQGRRCYPGLSNAEWYPVIDRECIPEGVILKVRGGGRFVWCRHLRFRDLPTPG